MANYSKNSGINTKAAPLAVTYTKEQILKDKDGNVKGGNIMVSLDNKAITKAGGPAQGNPRLSPNSQLVDKDTVEFLEKNSQPVGKTKNGHTVFAVFCEGSIGPAKDKKQQGAVVYNFNPESVIEFKTKDPARSAKNYFSQHAKLTAEAKAAKEAVAAERAAAKADKSVEAPVEAKEAEVEAEDLPC